MSITQLVPRSNPKSRFKSSHQYDFLFQWASLASIKILPNLLLVAYSSHAITKLSVYIWSPKSVKRVLSKWPFILQKQIPDTKMSWEISILHFVQTSAVVNKSLQLCLMLSWYELCPPHYILLRQLNVNRSMSTGNHNSSQKNLIKNTSGDA